MTYLNTAPKGISETSPGHIFAVSKDERLETAMDQLSASLAGYEAAALPEDRPKAQNNAASKAPAAFKNAPRLIDTVRLRTLLPAFIAQLYAMFTVDCAERGAASRLRDLRRALAGLFKAEKQNYVASLTHAVQSNPDLQSQIREDLGGEDALRRWEERRDAMTARGLHNSGAAQEPKKAKPLRRKTAAILTDRTGLFRLAALQQSKTRETRARISPSVPSASANLRAPAPIGLTPEQLRPHETSSQKGPSLARLQKTWETMQSEHYVWDLLLMIAELMTFSKDVRRAYAPP